MRNVSRKKLSVAITAALNAGVVVGLAAPAAYAQQATPSTTTTPPPAPQKIERVEVTGSRLPSPTLESVSPVNVISAQDIKWDGITNTSDIINQLPSAFADYGSNLSNGATGTSTVNLRNLGSSRTLVLIDGKRVPAGSPQFWATDINAIPAPLIQRIEVLTGGASAVYGSDAIAGVVNFIMNDHFEGVQVQWNGNGYNHQQNGSYGNLADRAATNPAQYQVPGDQGFIGYTQDANILIGGNFANGKGNATLFMSYRHSNPITQDHYNYSACAFSSTKATATKPSTLTCGGSGTNATGYFYNTKTGDIFTIADAAGNVRPFTSNDLYNFAPTNYYQRPQTTYGFNAFTHYDVFPMMRVYGEFDFSSNQTIAQIAPGGEFFSKAYTFNNNDPLLSQSFKDAFGITATSPSPPIYIGRRNVEGGGRYQDITLQDYRYVLGAKGGVLDDTWNYNFWWQSGRNTLTQVQGNYFDKTKIARSLNVVSDPVTGKPTCASVLDGTDKNCVPWDIFHLGGVTQAALDYLNTPGFSNGYTSQSVIGLQFDSDLGAAYGWRTPWSKDGAAVAFGFERRVEKLNFAADDVLKSANLSGGGGAVPNVSGQYTVKEAYVEARLPIIEQMPGAYLLSINGSYRYSDYSIDQTTNSYGLGVEWAPVKDYKLRGTYQQAVRAPNIIELFTPQGLNLFNMANDPCAGPTPSATLAGCVRSGLDPSKYGSPGLKSPAGQYNFLQGGNANLAPETANTYTVGLVMTPWTQFSATIDYWNIKLKDQISIIPSAQALTSCVTDGSFCDLIHRDPATGSLWRGDNGYVIGTNINIGAQSTDGIDITLNYNQPIQDWGSLGVTLVGTWLDTFKTTPIPGGGSYDCAGLYGPTCGTPLPIWRSKLRGTWNTPWNVNLALTWRYFSSVDIDTSSSQALLAGAYDSVNQHLGSQNYIDFAVAWNIDKNWTLYAGANNIFDKDPPIISSAIAGPPYGNGNTYPQVYDSLGRNLFLSITGKY
jgi:outer membrane receptor protein involved in Fe transport